jgi:hypothetical protein
MDIDTKEEDKELEDLLHTLAEQLLYNSKPLDPKYVEIVNKRLWDLLPD